MKELRKEILNKARSQTFKQSEVNGVDVVVWLVRHLGYLLVIVPIAVFVSTAVWRLYMKPEVRDVAMALDKPIITRIDTLETRVQKNVETDKKTFYLVKKMELVQRRTAPLIVVKEADEEIEIEKILDKQE